MHTSVMHEGTMATEKQVTKSAKMFWGSAVDVSQEEVTWGKWKFCIY